MATQTTTVSKTLPDVLNDVWTQIVNEAKANYELPYTPYDAQRIAGLTPDQQAGIAAARGNIGAYAPYYGQASDIAAGLARYAQPGGMAQISAPNINAPSIAAATIGAKQFPGSDLSAYMNPYESLVTGQSIRALQDAASRQQADADARFSRAGAFGGSRQGVFDANLATQVARQSGELANTSRAQNYTNAQNMWTADANRLLQADTTNMMGGLTAAQANANNYLTAARSNADNILKAGQINSTNQLQGGQLALGAGQLMTNLGSLTSQAGRQDAQSLLDIGGLQRGLDQSNLDLAYKDFQDQQNYPWSQLQRLTGAISGNPQANTGLTTQNSPGANQLIQALGGTAAGIALLKQLGVFNGGGGGGGGLGDLGPVQGADIPGIQGWDYTPPTFDSFQVPYSDIGVPDTGFWADLFNPGIAP